ncbi:cell division protein FtsL [Desulfatiglans anilini]|uniref:cell division protein FtsL n=1 Tax=Desulfatiglans anilini TaxID=90728 RepID=UPI00048325FA|nr:cell division protein FtsL [Desulfatiglans anilini]
MNRSEQVHRMLTERNAKTGMRMKNASARKRRWILTRRQVLWIILLLAVFMLSGIGYVWSNFQNTQIGYELSQLKRKEIQLREINRKLRAELAFLKSPRNLQAQATEKLGLKEPSPEQIVVIP